MSATFWHAEAVRIAAERDAALKELHAERRRLNDCSAEGGLIAERLQVALRERDDARAVARTLRQLGRPWLYHPEEWSHQMDDLENGFP